MPIYIKKIPSRTYKRIIQNPDDWHNLGTIERNGALNLKPELRELLNAENANVHTHPDWHISPDGHMSYPRGTGFEGYIKFDNPNAAIEYLKQYCEVMRGNRRARPKSNQKPSEGGGRVIAKFIKRLMQGNGARR